MVNEIQQLPNGDFEVVHLGENTTVNEPYIFARDIEIELKIANDKRRKAEGSTGNKSEDKQGPWKRNSYVPGGDWGHGD